MDRNTGFAQYGLRNAGQLVRIGPSLGMADFISNSAILLPIRPSAVLTAAPNSCPWREKWQACAESLPLGLVMLYTFQCRQQTRKQKSCSTVGDGAEPRNEFA